MQLRLQTKWSWAWQGWRLCGLQELPLEQSIKFSCILAELIGNTSIQNCDWILVCEGAVEDRICLSEGGMPKVTCPQKGTCVTGRRGSL